MRDTVRAVASLHNPVAVKDFRGVMRSWRSSALLSTQLAILGVVTVGLALGHADDTAASSTQAGRELFQALALVQLGLILLLTPVSLAAAVNGERQRGTWDLLLMTRLSSLRIARGKLLGALAFDLVSLITSVPLFSLSFLLGGVGVDDLARAFAVILATALLCSTLTLLLSALIRQLVVSMIAGVGVALCLSAGLSLLILGIGDRGSVTVGAYTLSPQLSRLAPLDPLAALASALPNGHTLSLLGPLALIQHPFGLSVQIPLWSAYDAVALSLSAALLWAASAFIRSETGWPVSA